MNRLSNLIRKFDMTAQSATLIFAALDQMHTFNRRQPKLNIREPLNYKDLYGNTTDLRKMVETNIVLSIKST